MNVCHTTFYNFLRKVFKKPRRARTSFVLSAKNKEKRKIFAGYIIEK